MKTLDPDHYDFLERFPIPDDHNRRRGGRQGLLEQKECTEASDADWIAEQHAAWADTLAGVQHQTALIDWSLAHGLDPTSRQAPRQRKRWPQIEHAWQRERKRLAEYRRGLLDDYANYFGTRAADRFAAFVAGIETFEAEQGEPYDNAIRCSSGTECPKHKAGGYRRIADADT